MKDKARLILIPLVLVALVGAACNSEEPDDNQAAAAPSPSPEPEPAKCPLNGEEPPKGLDVTTPAIALKIENSPEARPQSGLEDADLVYEEVVEGGITRFMAIFHCGTTDQGGPVRSARFDDPKIAKPFTHLLAYSGSNAIVDKELKAQDIIPLNEDTDPVEAFFRVPEGVLEVHNLFADVGTLQKIAAKREVDPPSTDVFTFGDVPAGAKKARSISLNFTASNTIEYKWAKDAWARSEAGAPFMTAEAEQIEVPNLLIQEVRVDNSNTIVDVAGNPSPDIDLLSGGKALLFRDGKVVKGRWDVDKDGVPSFTTASGDPMTFAPGPIWVELVPSKKGEVKGSFSFK
ncbi:MAG: DUF3048 domain-containing protein [Actinomycetota bacterium]